MPTRRKAETFSQGMPAVLIGQCVTLTEKGSSRLRSEGRNSFERRGLIADTPPSEHEVRLLHQNRSSRTFRANPTSPPEPEDQTIARELTLLFLFAPIPAAASLVYAVGRSGDRIESGGSQLR